MHSTKPFVKYFTRASEHVYKRTIHGEDQYLMLILMRDYGIRLCFKPDNMNSRNGLNVRIYRLEDERYNVPRNRHDYNIPSGDYNPHYIPSDIKNEMFWKHSQETFLSIPWTHSLNALYVDILTQFACESANGLADKIKDKLLKEPELLLEAKPAIQI